MIYVFDKPQYFFYACLNRKGIGFRVLYLHPKGTLFVLKKTLLLILIPLLIVVCAVAGLIVELRTYAETPANVNALSNVIISVRPGQTLRTTANLLQQANLINGKLKFILIARINGSDKHLKAGEYLLSASMPPRRILKSW